MEYLRFADDHRLLGEREPGDQGQLVEDLCRENQSNEASQSSKRANHLPATATSSSRLWKEISAEEAWASSRKWNRHWPATGNSPADSIGRWRATGRWPCRPPCRPPAASSPYTSDTDKRHTLTQLRIASPVLLGRDVQLHAVPEEVNHRRFLYRRQLDAEHDSQNLEIVQLNHRYRLTGRQSNMFPRTLVAFRNHLSAFDDPISWETLCGLFFFFSSFEMSRKSLRLAVKMILSQRMVKYVLNRWLSRLSQQNSWYYLDSLSNRLNFTPILEQYYSKNR